MDLENRRLGMFYLGDKEQRKIRERFKNQYNLAKQKFKKTSENHGIFINMPHPLGVYGEKLQIYLNKILHSNLPENLIYLGFFFQIKYFCMIILQSH